MFAVAIAAAGLAAGPIVDLPQGRAQGAYALNDSVYIFKGLPYAAPPVGDLRFAPTQAAKGWEGVLDATEFAPGCPQNCTLQVPSFTCPAKISEDCLYLNIYGPKDALEGGEKLPVMFFIHGGDYDSGSGGVGLYEGKEWAQRSNMVLVTISYRLGFLGAGYLPDAGINGNFNLLDQRQAMMWVRDNIHVFGGDNSNVLLIGQSAGGCSVAAHLTSPKSKGLFHKAVVLSNPYGLPMMTADTQQRYTQKLLNKMGCPEKGQAAADCVKNLTTDEIIAVQHKTHPQVGIVGNLVLDLFMPFTPVAGTEELPVQPLEAADKGTYNGVPAVFSTLTEEAIQFVYEGITFPITALESEAVIDVLFGIHAPKLKSMYPKPEGKDTRMWLSAIVTDYVFTCPTRRAASAHVNAGLPGWRVEYTHHNSFTQTMFNSTNPIPSCIGKVCHASDLPLYFGTWGGLPGPEKIVPTAEELVLSEQMQAVLSFLHTSGNFGERALPNSNTTAPAFKVQAPEALQFETPAGVLDEYKHTFCDFYDSIGYSRR